ncbi:hypothetical protein GCM10010244_10480 [Streptomyces coeruleorubidus]|nr:hypothetical protein GCM10010244_10480 [Streptomyces bellus]
MGMGPAPDPVPRRTVGAGGIPVDIRQLTPREPRMTVASEIVRIPLYRVRHIYRGSALREESSDRLHTPDVKEC